MSDVEKTIRNEKKETRDFSQWTFSFERKEEVNDLDWEGNQSSETFVLFSSKVKEAVGLFLFCQKSFLLLFFPLSSLIVRMIVKKLTLYSLSIFAMETKWLTKRRLTERFSQCHRCVHLFDIKWVKKLPFWWLMWLEMINNRVRLARQDKK